MLIEEGDFDARAVGGQRCRLVRLRELG